MKEAEELIEKAVLAVQEGRISVEELLQGALDARGGYAQRLGAELDRVARREPRAQHLRRRTRLGPKTYTKLLKHARATFGEWPGVVHVSWGRKYTGGRPVEGPALVVWVKEKREVAEEHRFPAVFRVGKRGRAIPIDVQQVPNARRHAGSQIFPGRGVVIQVGPLQGTLGGALQPGTKGIATLLVSGHVGRPLGAKAIALIDSRNVRVGTVQKSVVTDTMDGALIGGEAMMDLGALVDKPAREIRALRDEDGHPSITIQLLKRTVHTTVDSCDAPATFDDGQTMKGIIQLSTRATNPGDSGAPALDYLGRIVGFVVGASPSNTFLVSAKEVVDALK